MTDWKKDILNWLDFYSSCEMLEAQGLEKKLIKIVEEVEAKARVEERERVVGLIKSKKPNEYAVRYYKTLRARTWDEKNIVIEALDDLLSSLDESVIKKE